MSQSDRHRLERFVEAQAPVYPQVVAELRNGRKASHWMWYIFPQAVGLGRSAMAERYAIGSLAEARAYLAHPVLGPRLRECTARVNRIEGSPIGAILGTPDDLKFHSSMTLFAAAAPGERCFSEALARYFGGRPDPRALPW